LKNTIKWICKYIKPLSNWYNWKNEPWEYHENEKEGVLVHNSNSSASLFLFYCRLF
jgi:hypothetical protein